MLEGVNILPFATASKILTLGETILNTMGSVPILGSPSWSTDSSPSCNARVLSRSRRCGTVWNLFVPGSPTSSSMIVKRYSSPPSSVARMYLSDLDAPPRASSLEIETVSRMCSLAHRLKRSRFSWVLSWSFGRTRAMPGRCLVEGEWMSPILNVSLRDTQIQTRGINGGCDAPLY